MKIAVIGDNCIDFYHELQRYYETGNVVDTGANLIYLGNDVSIITSVGTDHNSNLILDFLNNYGFDTSHVTRIEGQCAVTYMSMDGKERVHGEYFEGVQENMTFSDEDILFAASHEMVHSALWGKTEDILKEIKRLGKPLISFDYADRLNSEIIDKTIQFVDIGFFSYDRIRDQEVEDYLKDKVTRGMKIAIATMGEHGSLAYDGKKFYQAGIVETEVVNTVGAGDSFIAGFLDSYLKGMKIEECLKNGSQLASQIVSRFEPWIPKEEKL